ncbi:MAG: hypothetical protein CL933_24575 [Deltaproteobacteria bacterium]|nr:hypothetical protein [Deltaproteobacteria bacterium]
MVIVSYRIIAGRWAATSRIPSPIQRAARCLTQNVPQEADDAQIPSRRMIQVLRISGPSRLARTRVAMEETVVVTPRGLLRRLRRPEWTAVRG